MGANYCSIDTTAYTANTASITVTSTYTADFNKIIFSNNVYTANFYTGGVSLIHLNGAPRVFFSDEAFTNNGDNCEEALTIYGGSILGAASSEIKI